MHATDTPLWAREDTFLGVCEGLGQEIGVNANWLRIALALGLFWNPTAVVVGYVVVGVLLALFRWAFPFHRATPASAAPRPAPHGDNDDAVPALADAA